MDSWQLLCLSSHVPPSNANRISLIPSGAFGAFFLSFGVLINPVWGIAGAYSATGNAAEGAGTPAYNVAIGFYLMFWGLVLILLLVGSTRTNLVFVFVFVTLNIGVWLLVAAFFKVASGDDALAGRLQKVCARQREEFNCRPGGLFFLRRRLVYSICLSLSCWPSLGLRFLSLSEIFLDFGREVEGLQGRIARIEYGLTI